MAEWAEYAEDAGATLQQLGITANHKSVGMTVLMLVLIRLVWRLTHPAPAVPSAMPRWQQRAATTAHVMLYGLIFTIPLSGWLMSSAAAYSVSWFNLFTFPDLVSADTGLKELFEEVHETLTSGLFVLALGHIGVAFWHHFRDRDDVLRGMSNFGSISVAVAILCIGLFVLDVKSSEPIDAEPDTANGLAATGVTLDEVLIPSSTLAQWAIDPDKSAITFTAEQAGAEFSGKFANWHADIRFSESDLEQSRARVEIELASVDTDDQDRDETLATPEWFNGGRAIFHATEFEKIAQGQYRALDATLDFGGQPTQIAFEFGVETSSKEDGGANRFQKILTGETRLDRIALGVGTGDWLDTTWVGQHIDVSVVIHNSELTLDDLPN
ncbi:MAG: cytochrome b561/polyisoprenoid-binding protein YceI [Candidatus Azotimanducaceae bacterium]